MALWCFVFIMFIFVWFFLLFFLVWNMWMASFLTIPLYKLMCNLSDIEVDFLFSFFCKELNLFNDFLFFSNDFFTFYSNIEIDLFLYFNKWLNMYVFVIDDGLEIENKKMWNIDVWYGVKKTQNVDNNFEVKFFSKVSNFSLLEFKSLQESIIICPGETGLVFFRLFNPMSYELTGMSLYFIYPSNISIYVHKIQCFCFDLIKIKSNESIELPILFYLDSLLWYDNSIFERLIYISYIFFLR